MTVDSFSLSSMTFTSQHQNPSNLKLLFRHNNPILGSNENNQTASKPKGKNILKRIKRLKQYQSNVFHYFSALSAFFLPHQVAKALSINNLLGPKIPFISK